MLLVWILIIVFQLYFKHSLQIYRNNIDSFYIDVVSCNITVILVVFVL